MSKTCFRCQRPVPPGPVANGRKGLWVYHRSPLTREDNPR